MNFQKVYRYGVIFARCCANCEHKRRGSIWYRNNRRAYYCKIQAACTHKQLEEPCNEVAPNGICSGHEYDKPTFAQIEACGFKKGKVK